MTLLVRLAYKTTTLLLVCLGLLSASLIQADHEEDSISSDQSCYERGESILVSFRNIDNSPDSDDWIALYPTSNFDRDALEDTAAMWVFTCGDQSCSSERRSGDVEFGRGGPDWPLRSGRYRAVLIGGSDEAPYSARAVSRRFTVMPQGESCDDDDDDDDDDNDDDNDDDDEEEEEEPEEEEVDSNMVEVIASARADIEALIDRDSFLGAKFLRLAFHDCVGGCDGRFIKQKLSVCRCFSFGKLTFLPVYPRQDAWTFATLTTEAWVSL